jgi:hypothetical protein
MMRFCQRAPGGLWGGVGQDLVDRGLPTCSRVGEAAMDGGAGKFVGVGWAPATDDILGEVLQLEEGKGKVGDHPVREERCVGASSSWKGIGGVGSPKCGEEQRQFGHWRGREAEGRGRVLAVCFQERKEGAWWGGGRGGARLRREVPF